MKFLSVSCCGGMLPQYMRVGFETGTEREYMWTAESEQDRRWRFFSGNQIRTCSRAMSARLSALYDAQEVL